MAGLRWLPLESNPDVSNVCLNAVALQCNYQGFIYNAIYMMYSNHTYVVYVVGDEQGELESEAGSLTVTAWIRPDCHLTANTRASAFLMHWGYYVVGCVPAA